MEQMKKALTKMGYRNMNNNVWGKPLGNTLVTFEFDKLMFTQWFKSGDETLIWTSAAQVVEDEAQNLIQIKSFENYSCRLTLGSTMDSFEFLTANQVLEDLL